jgi:hypothetical protein
LSLGGKQAFHEEWASDHADPLGPEPSYQFDYEEVDRRLGNVPERDARAELRAELGSAISLLLEKLAEGTIHPGGEAVAGRRLIGLLWAMRPDKFGGKSMAQVAQEMNVPVRTMQHYAGLATRTFGVRNRGQAHGHGKYEKHAKKNRAAACIHSPVDKNQTEETAQWAEKT